jgi:hypothetical protein
MTKHGDIAFGFNFLPSEGGEIEVISSSRVPSDKGEISGTYHAPSEGTACLYWDNSFSWLTPKDLSYTLKISQVVSFHPKPLFFISQLSPQLILRVR